MNMGMHDRLTGRRSVVQADIEPIGLQLNREIGSDKRYQLPYGLLRLLR